MRLSAARLSGLLLAIALTLALAGDAGVLRAQQSPPDQWRTFEGTWSAVGRRQTLRAEESRVAAIIGLAGAVTVTSGTGLGRGFHGEAIGFDDGRGVIAGRAVWTDANGDRVFSVLKGEPPETGRRTLGTITGGTGRYAGLTGDYAFSWQYVVRGDDDTVQGRTVDLKGRFRPGETRR